MPTLVINSSSSSTATNADAHIASIGYENHFRTGTVTVSSENATYPKENAYNWLDHDYFKFDAGSGTHDIEVELVSATSADYYAIHKHNLSDVSASIMPQYSTDGITWTDAAASSYTPSTNDVIMVQFDSISRKFWRLRITTTNGDPQLGVVAIGNRLDMDYGLDVGFEPPNFGASVAMTNNLSEGAVFLGSTVRKEAIPFTIRSSLVPQTWVRSNWLPLIQDHAPYYPFFFAWSGNRHPSEVVYAWIKDEMPSVPPFSRADYMTVQLQCKGVYES